MSLPNPDHLNKRSSHESETNRCVGRHSRFLTLFVIVAPDSDVSAARFSSSGELLSFVAEDRLSTGSLRRSAVSFLTNTVIAIVPVGSPNTARAPSCSSARTLSFNFPVHSEREAY